MLNAWLWALSLPAPQGKAYQLWFFSATQKVPVGLIRTDAEGRFFMKFPVPKDAAGATAVVVTSNRTTALKFPRHLTAQPAVSIDD